MWSGVRCQHTQEASLLQKFSVHCANMHYILCIRQKASKKESNEMLEELKVLELLFDAIVLEPHKDSVYLCKCI